MVATISCHAVGNCIATKRTQRRTEEEKTPDERCKKLKQVAHISFGCAASTKGKRGAVGPESEPLPLPLPGCSRRRSCRRRRRRSRAQRDDKEKQFTKSTQRLDQKQRRRVASQRCRRAAQKDAPMETAAPARCYTTQNTSLSIKFLKWNFKSLKQKGDKEFAMRLLYLEVARWKLQRQQQKQQQHATIAQLLLSKMVVAACSFFFMYTPSQTA